jgi:hypothetical protein
LFACVSVCALLAVRPVEIDGFAICLDFDSLNLGTSAARDSMHLTDTYLPGTPLSVMY